ncbi:MAG: hypothetical protein O3A95_10010 [Planctomycetota bacterium]|nr:hypothetical protein [Planctomycetota bacterium]MDA1114617.1 hypothetical protein [Planctomycetota bacterium]
MKEVGREALPVDYTNVVPEIDAIKLHTEPVVGDDQLHALFLTKAKSWEYEKEWRILNKVANTKYTYLPEVLSNVYLGAKSDASTADSIREALDNAGCKAKVWKGIRSQDEFRIVFNEIS